MSVLQWRPLADSDLEGLQGLARECLAADGGLPMLDSAELVRELFRSGPGIGGFDDLGELVAAAAMLTVGSHPAATGLVHPAMRRQGHGEELVAWCRRQAGDGPVLVIAETMSPEAESLFASAGLRRTFAETVMVHEGHRIPKVARPVGLTLAAFEPQTEATFDAAFRAALADQPGYRHTSAAQWLADERASRSFRPADSRVALDADGAPAGFVLVSDDWIDLVAVTPQWRGKRLGAHLVVRSLSALRRAGSERVWLCVNVANSARDLYERLGFRAHGSRARYESRDPAVFSELSRRAGMPE